MIGKRAPDSTHADDDKPYIGRPSTPHRKFSRLPSPTEMLQMLKSYFGLGRKRDEPVDDLRSLAEFLNTRASFIAQTSLYGYLRTRAGMRYPELFDDDPFVESINIAKWHVWLGCLSDLSVFAGGILMRDGKGTHEEVSSVMVSAIDHILAETGIPHDCGPEFSAHADQVRSRIVACDWAAITDDEAPFTESPDALVDWAPVMKELKELDEEVVRNSISFRWQEVRRDLRRNIRPVAVVSGTNPPPEVS